MRKSCRYILLPLLIFLTTALSACSQIGDIPNAHIPTRFESDFSASCSELEISGHISKLDTGIYTLVLTAPKSLESVEINCIGDKISISFNGTGFQASSEALPITGFIKAVTGSLDTAGKSGNVEVTKSDGYNKYSAASGAGDFYILQEQSGENIASLVIKSADISMNFSNFSTE